MWTKAENEDEYNITFTKEEINTLYNTALAARSYIEFNLRELEQGEVNDGFKYELFMAVAPSVCSLADDIMKQCIEIKKCISQRNSQP